MLWQEQRAPELPPRQTQGDLQWTHLDPLKDFVFSQNNWDGGALKITYSPDNINGYESADGCDAANEVITLAIPRGPRHSSGDLITSQDENELMGFDIEDQFFTNGVSRWVAGAGATVSQETSDVNSAGGALKIVTDGSRISGQTLATYTYAADEKPAASTDWAFEAIAKRTVGDADIEIEIQNGSSGNTATTATITSSSFTSLFAEENSGIVTTVTIKFKMTNNETTATTIIIDDMFSVRFNADSDSTKPAGLAQVGGVLYGAWGNVVYVWDDTDSFWRISHTIVDSNIIDIIAFQGNIYLALGSTLGYIYGTDTAGWTVSTKTSPDDDAFGWAISKDSNGLLALWRAETESSVSSSSNPINGGAVWSDPVSLGDSTPDITNMFGVFDSLLVGKAEGLFEYTRYDPNNTSGDNTFKNVAEDFEPNPSEDNFINGVPWHGWLWLSTSEGGFLRYRPGELQDLSAILRVSTAGDIAVGPIRTFVSTPRELYLIFQENTSFHLGVIIEKAGQIIFHILDELKTSDLDDFGISSVSDVGRGIIYTDGTYRFLIVQLQAKTPHASMIRVPSAVMYRLPSSANDELPIPVQNAASNDKVRLTGTFKSSRWDGNLPDTPKTFVALTVRGAAIAADGSVAVVFFADGGAQKTLGTFSGSGEVQTLYFHDITDPVADAIGRTIQLEFTITRSSKSITPPQVYAFALHSVLNPRRVRTWTIDVHIGDNVLTESGLPDPQSADTILANLDTLELQDYPIILKHDLDQDGTEEEVVVQIRNLERIKEDGIAPDVDTYRLTLQEVLVAD